MTIHLKPIKYSESYTSKDLERIIEITNSCFPEHFVIDEIIKELKNKPGGIRLAYDKDNEKAIGFNIWHEDTDDKGEKFAYYWLHAVDKDYRRRGIAGKLMDLTISKIRSLGYGSVRLMTFDKMPAMIRLSLRKGFVRTKKVDFKYGENNHALHYYLNLKEINGNTNGYLKVIGLAPSTKEEIISTTEKILKGNDFY